MRLGRLRWARAGLRVCTLVCVCAALCCLLMASACAEDAAQEAAEPASDAAAHSISAVLPVTGGSVTVHAAWLDGTPWLFLPAHADMHSLRLVIDGAAQEPVDWTALAAETDEGVYSAPVPALPDVTLHVMHSQNLRALYLFSDDPVNEGRAWLEDSSRHERSTTAQMALVATDGSVDHAGSIDKLRGRGNSTWLWDKRPYQFKLSRKDDLLDTGDAHEPARRWVLLADWFDQTLLHNRVTFDLALELGLTETPRSEHIDLYYDGEYRGAYLLCEKVEVGEGRVDIVDYDKLIERWNTAAGIDDPDALPVAVGQNRYGCTYTYIEGLVDNGDPQSGGYLLEIEKPGITLSDRCWFTLGDGSTVALKSPENASESMMRFISEKLEEARFTLLSGGTDPQTGLTTADHFDVDSFAVTLLLGELTYNVDAFRHSSSFFVLDAGETRFRAGPLWDYDLAYNKFYAASQDILRCFKETPAEDNSNWYGFFYRDEAFCQRMLDLLHRDVLPVIERILLGNETGRYLRPLDAYAAQIEASCRMNDRLYQDRPQPDVGAYDSFEAALDGMRSLLSERCQWMAELAPGQIHLWSECVYACTEDGGLTLAPFAWSHWVEVRDMSVTLLQEADAEHYAVYRLDAVIGAQEGYALPQDPVVLLNGETLRTQPVGADALRIAVTFEDPSYRPVDYYGDDLGRVYDYAAYLQNHPEVAQEVGEDSEAVLEYFAYEGMEQGHKGNAFFGPREVARRLPDVADDLGDAWPLYYEEFISGEGREWMRQLERIYTFTVSDALE